MTTANPFVQFASKVGQGCEKAWGKEKTGKLSTVEVASFKPSKRIALAMMGWVMRSSDKVSARDSKSKNMISINSWVRTYPNRGIKRRKTNRSWAQVILSPPIPLRSLTPLFNWIRFRIPQDWVLNVNVKLDLIVPGRSFGWRLDHLCHSCQAKALTMCLSLLIPGMMRKKKQQKLCEGRGKHRLAFEV